MQNEIVADAAGGGNTDGAEILRWGKFGDVFLEFLEKFGLVALSGETIGADNFALIIHESD